MDEKIPERKPGEKIEPLRTYRTDVEEVLREGEGSFAKIAIAESEKRTRQGFTEEPETSSRSKIIVWTSVGLIIIGIVALSAVYFFRRAPTPAATNAAIRPIIAAAVGKNLDITSLNRDQIIAALVKERDKSVFTLSFVVAIKLTETRGGQTMPTSAPDFLAKLETGAPSELVRSLEDDFMFGLYALNKNQPFLILKTGYYQNAFAGMLAWESSLENDLGPIFIPLEPNVQATTSDQALKQSRAFEDAVVKNRDVRALRGKNGNIVLLYSFPDKSTIVITTDSDTLEKVASQLIAGKLVQ